jgi:cell division protein FtsQ
MTTLQKSSRANFVRQRRGSKAQSSRPSQLGGHTASRSYRPASVYLPGKPQPVVRRNGRVTTRGAQPAGYDIAFTLGKTKVQAPTLNLPQLGPRAISAGLTLFLLLLLYVMWTASPFMVNQAVVRGNQRLDAAEINAMLSLLGEPIFKAIPAQIEADLNTAFPELESVQVHVSLPNRILVEVVERVPLVAWYQEGSMTWIDANGVAFTPRGDTAGLLQVSANGAPAAVINDPDLPLLKQKFISPEMVRALLTLAPDVPAGMPMIFDPQYGMGWQDPRGWTVYFGHNVDDVAMKKSIYNTILEKLTQEGVQPSLISVEFLNAPFYK